MHSVLTLVLNPGVSPVVWGTPANFNSFRVLAALLHSILVVGVSQNFAALNRGRHLPNIGVAICSMPQSFG